MKPAPNQLPGYQLVTAQPLADALKQKAMIAKADIKAEIQETAAKLDENKRLLRRQLSELQSASGKRVDDLETETDKTLRELEQSYQQAIDRFSG